jgi:hypothetical protein
MAGVPLGAALTANDVAGKDALAAGCFQAKTPARGVAAVA